MTGRITVPRGTVCPLSPAAKTRYDTYMEKTPESMTDSTLSPAAQAVLAACGCPDPDSPFRLVARGFAGAALRAAADCLPIQPLTREPSDQFEMGLSQGQALSRAEILAIAAELEGA